jgi:hypothetical protein
MPDQVLNIANANGQIVASFTIPEGVPVGTKLVQFFGDQGSYGAESRVCDCGLD